MKINATTQRSRKFENFGKDLRKVFANEIQKTTIPRVFISKPQPKAFNFPESFAFSVIALLGMFIRRFRRNLATAFTRSLRLIDDTGLGWRDYERPDLFLLREILRGFSQCDTLVEISVTWCFQGDRPVSWRVFSTRYDGHFGQVSTWISELLFRDGSRINRASNVWYFVRNFLFWLWILLFEQVDHFFPRQSRLHVWGAYFTDIESIL